MEAKITPKNIPEVWEGEQHPVRKRVYEQLKHIKKNHPECLHAIIDAEQFEDEMHGHRVKPELQVSLEDSYVTLTWKIDDLTSAEIRFHGDGIWSGEAITPTKYLYFKELGHPMSDSKEDDYYTYEKDRSPFIFVLSDAFEEHVFLKSEFMNTYEPLYRKGDRCIAGHTVQIAWTTNVYDGPLSGYCVHNNRLHFFDMIEEQDIDRLRMFAIYKINWLERFFAYWKHLHWLAYLNNRLLWNFYMWKYRFKEKTKKWLYGEKFYMRDRAKYDKWLAKHKIVGFFSY